MYDLWLLQRQAMGKNGHRVVIAADGTFTLTKCVCAVHAITDIVIASLQVQLSDGTLNGQTIKAGDTIWGQIYGSFGITSGVAILYYGQ